MCSIDKNIAILLVSRYQKVSRHTRYQYRENLVSRYIVGIVSIAQHYNVGPIPLFVRKMCTK